MSTSPGLVGAGTLHSFFGDGSDGSLTVSGSTSLTTSDGHYTNLTINNGGNLNVAGFRIYVQEILTINTGGIISNNGAAGNNGQNQAWNGSAYVVPAAAALGGTATLIGGGGSGGGGAYNGGIESGNNGYLPHDGGGGHGTAPAVAFPVGPNPGTAYNLGGSGGKGGNSSSWTGMTPPSITAPTAANGGYRQLSTALLGFQICSAGTLALSGGGGGGGGAADNCCGVANRGGWGGGGGGAILICARKIILNGTIDASGGAGGGPTANNSGGGGGGGGGCIFIIYNEATVSTSFAAQCLVNGGAQGAGTIQNGAAGSNGTLFTWQI